MFFFFIFMIISILFTPAADSDFDLADALDPNNDIAGKDKGKGREGMCWLETKYSPGQTETSKQATNYKININKT